MDFKNLKVNDEVFLIKKGMYMEPQVVTGIISYKGTKKLKIKIEDIEYSLTKDKFLSSKNDCSSCLNCISFDSFCKDAFYIICENEKDAYRIIEEDKMKDDLISYIKESLKNLTIEQLQEIKDMLIV